MRAAAVGLAAAFLVPLAPTWGDGGKALAQTADGAPGEVRKLSGIRFSYPTYTPSGDILYESMAAGSWDLYTMPGDGMDDGGTVIDRLTDAPGMERMPSMSPDGRWIAYVSDADGSWGIWRMDADGSNPVRLTTGDLPEIHPYWTPDGRRVVFNRRVRGERLYGLWSVAADGSDEEEILTDDRLNSYAQPSPDGRFLVYDTWWGNDDTNGELMLLELETRALTRLTDNDAYDGYPTWHPDGRHVIYSSEVEGNFKLFRLDVTTGERVQLTFGPGDDQRPDVAPDGTRIVFNRTLDDSVEIHELVLSRPTGPG